MSLLDSTDTSARLAAELGTRVGYEFVDTSLGELALRHRSWCSEHGAVESNERLEFLGDSVLGIIVTDRLFRRLSQANEGALARQRAELVNWRLLATVARDLGVGPLIRLGRGEAATGGAEKASILADALEAIIGAIYLDGGLETAGEVVLGWLATAIDAAIAGEFTDYKSRLQERAAEVGQAVPLYVVSESGPDHSKWFSATVQVGERASGRGEGFTKKEAEQAAAHLAFKELGPTEAETTDTPAIEPSGRGTNPSDARAAELGNGAIENIDVPEKGTEHG